MNRLECPHCQARKLNTPKMPKEVVVVTQCPSCQELVVLFRRKAIALDRDILESGSRDERKNHLAEVIAEFLDSGVLEMNFDGSMLPFGNAASDAEDGEAAEGDTGEHDDKWMPPISQREVEDFTSYQLTRLDNAEYFRKHLG